MLFHRLAAAALACFVVISFSLCNPACSQDKATAKSAATQDKACDCDCEDGTCNGQCKTTTAVASADFKKDDDKTSAFASTHIQTGNFKPQLDDKDAALHTFRVRGDGNVVVCVSYAEKKESAPKGFIQVYTPDFELVEQFELGFEPYSLEIDPSGTMYVAGEGKIAKVSRTGEVEKTVTSPTMDGVDMEQLKKDIIDEMTKSQKEMAESFGKEIEQLQEKVDRIEETDEADRTKKKKRQHKNLTTQLEQFKSMVGDFDMEVNDEMVEWQMQSKSAITALAITEKDLFVSTAARKGFGYDVYRMTHDLDGAEVVLEGLRGCCGQMDIHARDGQIFVAENTKFSVGIYDRDGEEISSFGERLSGNNQGFGSCCNPMNIFCCPNGDVLTAESSIGKIKRFDSEGNLIGYVGRARIGGGCKHVAFGVNEELDRFYVQYEDKNEICILNPADEVSVAADPRMNDLSIQLAEGTWELQVDADAAKDKEEPKEESSEDDPMANFSFDSFTNMKSIKFGSDGSFVGELEEEDGFGMGGGEMKWLATKADGDTLFLDVEQADDTIQFRVVVKFSSETEAKISVTYDGLGEQGDFRSFKLKEAVSEEASAETTEGANASDIDTKDED